MDPMDNEDQQYRVGVVWFEFPLAGPNAGHSLRVDIPLPMLWHIYRAMHEGSPEVIVNVIQATFTFADFAEQANVPHPVAATFTIWGQLFHFFGFDRAEIRISDTLEPASKEHVEPASEEHVLEFTYTLLRNRLVTHQIAAELAQLLLQRENITDNSWRKKVDRWAQRKEKPSVSIYKRGRSKEK